MEAPKNACPICLEDIHQEASVVHPCNHAFCLECITKWTDNTPTCPLCLKSVDKITRSRRSEEDVKEETYELRVSAKGTKKSTDEEFECFDHDYFVHQFRELFRQAKDAEFSLKSQIGIKKKALQLEKNYQLALHMKQEIDMKLNYLARVKKISPRDLLQDIEHFCDLLRKINYSEEVVYYNEYGYADEGQYDDCYEYYGEEADNDQYSMYSVAVTKSVSKKKKNNKGKQKNKKDDTEHNNARIALS